MRHEVKEKGFESEVLLQPITLEAPHDTDITGLQEMLAKIGFDLADFGQNKVIIHAVPKVFADWKVDIELVMNWVWSIPSPPAPLPEGEGSNSFNDGRELFTLMIDEIVGMKACKASIKAGQRLSLPEMEKLINDGITYVQGMFVCQHGRPAVVAVAKTHVEKLFERH